jgi:WD40 repeat protein
LRGSGRFGLRSSCVVLLLLAAAAGAQEKPRLVAQIGHTELVSSLAWSVNKPWLLTGGRDGAVLLWDVASQRELRRLTGHGAGVHRVALSPDNRRAFTADRERVHFWDLHTGKRTRSFDELTRVSAMAYSPTLKRLLVAGEAGDRKAGTHRNSVLLLHARTARIAGRIHVAATGTKNKNSPGDPQVLVSSAAIDRRGRRILLGCDDSTARLYDKKGKELLRFKGHRGRVQAAAFSADGRQALTGCKDGVAILWKTRDGRELARFGPFEHNKTPNKKKRVAAVTEVSFFPDGKRALVVAFPLARVVDLFTGDELQGFDATEAAAPSPDGTRVATGLFYAAHLYDAANGQLVTRLNGHAPRTWRVVAHGGQIAVGLDFDTCVFWDAVSGRPTLRTTDLFDRFKGSSWVEGVAYSPNGRRLAAITRQQLSLIDTSSGERIWTRPIRAFLYEVVFSPAGTMIAVGASDGTRTFDAENGEPLDHDKSLEWTSGIAFSPDSKLLASVGRSSTVHIRDVASGKDVQRLAGAQEAAVVAFAPKRPHIAVGEWSGPILIWNLANGQRTRTLEGHTSRVTDLRYSADGRRILTASRDHTARIWNAHTGREIVRLAGHSVPVWWAVFTADERRVLTSGHDGVFVWDASTGREICRLNCFKDGSWAVSDPEGRYDASNGGAVEGLHWVYRDEAISLDQLKERYYDPGLLAKHLGFAKEPLRKVSAFMLPKLYPLVTLQAPTAKNQALSIKLKDRGGGIGRVVVKINGKEVTSDARGDRADSKSSSMKLEVPLEDDPRIAPGETNFLEVEVYNAEGYLRSRGMKVAYKAPGKKSTEQAHLWGIVAGTSDYEGDAIDLRYSSKDAADFANALLVAGSGLLGEKRVKVTLVRDATRKELVGALRKARRAKARDIVVVYLAGHGVNHGGDEDGDFFYLTKDAATADLADPEVRKRVAISSRELTKLLTRIPARKQVLILDTCSAGRFIEKLTEKRNVPSSQIRALERLKDRTGLHILAGCAADRVSYEATRHSLLLGMRGAALREGEFVDVLTLFGFAVDRVPRLAGSIGGVQRPVMATPKAGASFDIGRLDDEAKELVPLRSPRPLVLRTNFQDEDELEDVLKLAKRVDRLLNEASARGAKAELVFVDARSLPDACRVAGRYRVKGDAIEVDLRISRGDEKLARFSVKGEKRDLDGLAESIVEAVAEKLR